MPLFLEYLSRLVGVSRSNHRDIKGSCKTSQKRTDGLTRKSTDSLITERSDSHELIRTRIGPRFCAPLTTFLLKSKTCAATATHELPLARRNLIMASGTVKWFNGTKGFGFIQPDDGGQDVFVHISAVERAGMRDLRDGQKISYELVQDKRSGKMSADNLRAE
jgi:CspA family cold shock protein